MPPSAAREKPIHADADILRVMVGNERDFIVGRDPALREVLARAERVAPTRIPVLISGESGTGKELLARLIHDLGPVSSGPLVAVNCGTLPRELADSELFGHERGAFTGAGTRKAGWFEEGHGGTLVLDEIGELPLDLQPKLLRVLETGRVRRIGGSGEVTVHVRIIAVTLRDLRKEIERGAFRADLYHRLAGFELAMPPLRARRADIPLLIERFLGEWKSELGERTIDADATRALMSQAWPGNVRELRNVLRRAVILSPKHVTVEALELLGTTYGPSPGQDSLPPTGVPRLADGYGPPPHCRDDTLARDLLPLAGQTFEQIERAVLGWAMHRHGGSRRRAARSLEMARSTFCDKVKRYGIA